MMKVLTSDAVQDPTKVEARIRREVAMRKHTHEKMNEERKLTDEQRREKVETKKAEEDKRGIYGAVFKYATLPLSGAMANGASTESRSSQTPLINSKCAKTPTSSIFLACVSCIATSAWFTLKVPPSS